MIDKIMAVVFSLLILGQAYGMRLLVGTWLFPGCLFGLAWFAFTFVPLIVLLGVPVPVNPWAVAFICICCVAFSGAALFWDWRPLFKWNRRKQNAATIYGSRFLRRAFYFCSLSSVAFALLDWVEQGFSLRDLLFNIADSAFQYAQALYGQTMTQGINEKMALVTAYLSAILGGLTISSARKKWVVGLMSFFPAVLVGVTQTSKGLLFMCIAFFCAGLWVHRLSSGNARLISKSGLKKVVLGIALLVPLVLAELLLRHPADEIAPVVAYYGTSYCCGNLYAFSDWFSSATGSPHSDIAYTNERAPTGFFTFMAVFQAFGNEKATQMPMGIFGDNFTYEDLIKTNIYTVFRGLIMDFGLFGSVLFMFAAGVFFHQAFRVMLLKRSPTFAVAVFVFMVASIYISGGIGPFIWTRIPVAFFALWILLEVNKRSVTAPRTSTGLHPLHPSCS